MTEDLQKNRNEESINSISDRDVNELKKIITGLDQEELEKLKLWLSDSDAFAEELTEILPLAIMQLLEDDRIKPGTIPPIVEDAIESSVQTNPKRLADLLFPVMGPAIRKAVSEDMRRLIESINSSLESSLSPNRMWWRMQSVFSNRSFAEIALVHNLIYRVKQLFLIHSESGLLLQHVIEETDSYRDPDMVSAMLTAINDFVKDSFALDSSDEIQTIQIGNNTLWIEKGPHAVLAGIVEGNPPDELRDSFKRSIEEIHLQFGKTLPNFEGDVEPFENDLSSINKCLQKQSKPKKKGKPIILMVFVFLILAGLSYLLFIGLEQHYRWRSYLNEVENEAGILITKSGRKSGKLYIKGLRDPRSVNPQDLLKAHKFDVKDVIFDWQYFHSLNELFVVQNANERFIPDTSARFTYQDRILWVSGSSSKLWADEVVQNYKEIFGVDSINTDQLNTTNPAFDLDQYIREIEEVIIQFEPLESGLRSKHKSQIRKVAIKMFEMINYKPDELYFELVVIGFAKDDQRLEQNKIQINQRIESVRTELYNLLIPSEHLIARVVVFNDDSDRILVEKSVAFSINVVNLK